MNKKDFPKMKIINWILYLLACFFILPKISLITTLIHCLAFDDAGYLEIGLGYFLVETLAIIVSLGSIYTVLFFGSRLFSKKKRYIGTIIITIIFYLLSFVQLGLLITKNTTEPNSSAVSDYLGESVRFEKDVQYVLSHSLILFDFIYFFEMALSAPFINKIIFLTLFVVFLFLLFAVPYGLVRMIKRESLKEKT